MLRPTGLVLALGVLAAPVAPLSQGDQYFLLPGPDVTVVVDGHLTIAVHEAALDGGLAGSSVSSVTSPAWMVNGKPVDRQDPSAGSLRVGLVLDRATYTAPHTVPAKNPVAVSVSFRPGPDKAEVTLVCNVTIRDQGNFVTINGPGRPMSRYELDDRYSSAQMRVMFARGVVLGPELQINAGPLSAATKTPDLPSMTAATVSLLVAGRTPGSYAWSLPGSTATSVTLLIGPTQFLSADCRPHGAPDCKMIPLTGATHITSVDAATNAIRGNFEGQLVQVVEGKPTQYFSVTGGFNVTVQGVGSGRGASVPHR